MSPKETIVSILTVAVLACSLSGCAAFDRPGLQNDSIRAENEMRRSQAAINIAWANCMETYSSLKLARQEKLASAICGAPPPPSVTITVTNKTGEVSQGSLMPPLPMVGGILGVLP